MSVEADDTLKLCAAYPRLLLKATQIEARRLPG